MIKKLIIWGLGIFALLAVIVFGIMAYHELSYQWALSSKVTQYIYSNTKKWGETAYLLPDVFQRGQPRTKVEALVIKAGYRLDEQSVRTVVATKITAFTFYRAMPSFICNIKVYVKLKFDAQDALVSAVGSMKEHGCL